MKTRYIARHRRKSRFPHLKKIALFLVVGLLLVGLSTLTNPRHVQESYAPAVIESATDLRSQEVYPWTQFLPLGDSVTLGFLRVNGASVVENGYRADLWGRLFRRGLEPNFVGSCGAPGSCLPENPWPVTQQMGDWNHEGHAGWTTPRLGEIAVQRVLTYQPQYVLLLTGANDLGANHTPHDYIVSLAKLVDDIHAASPAVHIFVATPTFKGHEPDWWSYVQGAAAVGGSRPYTSVVPLHIVGQKAGELSDGVHPTRCGYARIAYVWYYYLERSPKINPNGDVWPTEYYPMNNPATGVCAGIA